MVIPKKKVAKVPPEVVKGKIEPVDKGVPTKVEKVKGGFNYFYEDGSKRFITRAEYFK